MSTTRSSARRAICRLTRLFPATAAKFGVGTKADIGLAAFGGTVPRLVPAPRTTQCRRARTGTAEFGPATLLRTHAWFVGYRGDVAFALLVPRGGVGGAVATPIATRFLNALPG